MEAPILISLMVLCLFVEAFFSGAEIGVVSADRIKLRHEAANGNRGAALAIEMLKKPEWLLSTTLIGTNIAIVTNTSLATLLAVQLFGKEYSWVAIVLAAPLIWVFGEIVPKSICQQKADVITPRVIFILRAASILFYPILLVFTAMTRLFTRLTGTSKEVPFTLRQEIDLMLGMPATQGDVATEERHMIRRMFNFSETKVRDIAITIMDVVALDHNSNCGQARRLASEKAHLRLPVFKGGIHRMVGVVDVRELIAYPVNRPIEDHVRPVRFVTPAMSIQPLLEHFRQSGERIAVVVDEFGAAEGIITLEDIMERIVGNLEDEYDRSKDKTQALAKDIGDRQLLVNPRLDLIGLKEEWGIEIPDGPYETLAGYLMEICGDIPRQGEIIKAGQWQFTILKADPHQLRQVRIQPAGQ